MGTWLILSFFLGFLPSMFAGALIGLAVSKENEWVGRLGLAFGIVGGVIVLAIMAGLRVVPEGFGSAV